MKIDSLSQSFENTNVSVKGIENLIITSNADFIFVQQYGSWFQFFLDENVLFVVQIDSKIKSYLADLDLKILEKTPFNRDEYFEIIFNFNKTLSFLQVKNRVNFIIRADCFLRN